ncbi:hypothetical protein Tco_0564004 [Tanacetum coccineum]
MVWLYIRRSKLRYEMILVMRLERSKRTIEMLWLYVRRFTISRYLWYSTLDVQDGRVDMLWLYVRGSTDESIWNFNTSKLFSGNFQICTESRKRSAQMYFMAEKIKTLEAKIKILEGALEMERHPEKHTLESAAILHELYNDMGKLGLEYYFN